MSEDIDILGGYRLGFSTCHSMKYHETVRIGNINDLVYSGILCLVYFTHAAQRLWTSSAQSFANISPVVVTARLLRANEADPHRAVKPLDRPFSGILPLRRGETILGHFKPAYPAATGESYPGSRPKTRSSS